MESALIFLLKLAWESRYRIPLIITLGFMALDIRMQLEINVNMRRVRRRNQQLQEQLQNDIDDLSDDDSNSWYTLDEESEIGDDSDDPDTHAVNNQVAVEN